MSAPQGQTSAQPEWRVDEAGWVVGIRQLPSPNFDERPTDCDIALLVIHAISLPPGEFGGEAIVQLFMNRLDPQAHAYFVGIASLKVSAHFLIRRDGQPLQFVACADRAWHAGASCFEGQTCCNDFSIGVELEGTDDQPFTDAQYAALARLTQALRVAYPLRAVCGHEHIAPGRKTDPGPCFDWTRFTHEAQLPEAWLRGIARS